ncbi:uncharacterized protein EHS24_006710 [Apiotrichum porosum]|uniref:Uncharacterized protein n=1 Tax=Apiotrichum porosum TaxID=105984 RepID=A0A427Y211_9TREE|nr:uncharacterized protein EHS24_006710 [Apiotrichum porosum]RSH85117.1 hypothetical protein EHS24_006710 [Apiotrichum porosum]
MGLPDHTPIRHPAHALTFGPFPTPAEWRARVDKDIERYYHAAADVLASSGAVPPPLDTIQPFITHVMEWTWEVYVPGYPGRSFDIASAPPTAPVAIPIQEFGRYSPEHAGYRLSRLVVDPEGSYTQLSIIQPPSHDGVIQPVTVKEVPSLKPKQPDQQPDQQLDQQPHQ